MIDQSAFSAFYNESEGVVLTWSTNEHERDPDTPFCENSRTFRVLTRSYASYEDYITRSERPDQVVDYSPTVMPKGSKFIFPEMEVRLDNYYVFDVQSQYSDSILRLRTFKVSSPLYYFGPQGKSLRVVKIIPLYLYVIERPVLVLPHNQVTTLQAPLGSTVELRCEGSGQPLPRVSLLQSGLHITSESREPNVALKNLVVTAQSAGVYNCFASSTYVPPEGGATPVFTYKTIVVQIRQGKEEELVPLIMMMLTFFVDETPDTEL